MTLAINEILEKSVGLACLRKEVGAMKSLSLGFGNEAPPRSREQHRRYRIWEMGTYGADWEITDHKRVVLSKRRGGELSEMNRCLESINLGRFVAIRQLSKAALRIELDNGLAVEISGDLDDDDEYFHIFCPENVYVEFSRTGWKIGRSDRPWK